MHSACQRITSISVISYRVYAMSRSKPKPPMFTLFSLVAYLFKPNSNETIIVVIV